MAELIRLLDRHGNASTIKVEDIIIIRPTAEGPEFHTRDNMYFYPSTMEELQILFGDSGFERLDRTNLVNMNHAVAFDTRARKVFFDDPATKESKFATVSEANLSKVEHLVRENQESYHPARKPLFGKG